ncbi:MAG: hypothetical protein JWO11_372, partial [Nocardioides sp.]|nr:hypothetical protein [Nocardioides sp.]
YSTPRDLRCVAHDGLSGVRTCRVTQRHHGHRFTYKAVAIDRADNRSVVRGSYRTGEGERPRTEPTARLQSPESGTSPMNGFAPLSGQVRDRRELGRR